MSFFSRIGRVWRAILNKFVTGVEDDYVMELAESQLQEATERLKEGRQGLTAYQALVLKVNGQVETGKSALVRLTAEIKTHLQAGNEDVAAELAMELNRVKGDLTANKEQLVLHQEAYENNLLKMKTALRDIQKAKQELQKKKAALKMEKALAEVAEAAGALNTSFDVSSDFGEIMSRIDDKINTERARSTVASDLSGHGVTDIKAKLAAEKAMAHELLKQFKIEEGLASPEPLSNTEKTMGSATETTPTRQSEPQSES